MGKGILVCAVLVAFARVTCADPVEIALRAGDLREQWAKRYRLVWEMSEVRTVFPVNPVAAREENRALEQFYVQQGARGRQLELARQQLRQMLSREISGYQTNLVGLWETEWGRDFLRVRGVRPLDPKGHVVMRWYMGNGWAIQADETMYAPGVSLPPTPPRLLVWCCEGECFRTADPTGGRTVPPEELALLACLNPLRVGGSVKWSVSKVQPKRVRLVSSGYIGYHPAVLEMELLAEREWVPVTINMRAIDDVDKGYYTVTRYRQVDGHWLPEEIKTTWRTRFWEIKRTWRLKSVEAGGGPTLAELASLGSAVGRVDVKDLRLLGCRLTVSDYVNRSQQYPEDIVYYRWRGRIPSLKELRAIHAKQQSIKKMVVGTVGAPWWRFVPPILLILIGAVWYWRLRRKARA